MTWWKELGVLKIKLIENSRETSRYKEIRNLHYVDNHGCIGKQIHYLIFENGDIPFEEPIGIISGASAVWACKPRDDFFGITKDNRIEIIDKIINNTVFRLEKHEKNLASRILSMFRKQVKRDWKKKYNSEIIGFETFVYGENRTGGIYKADNWIYVGVTKGSAKYKPHGAYNKGERKTTEQKLIFCRRITWKDSV